MIVLPKDATKLDLQHATVEFYTFKKEEKTYYYFDTSFCSAPEPMINAMAGLQLLDTSSKYLVMLNHSIPNALFPKIKENYFYEVIELNDGNFQIIFKVKEGSKPNTDFSDNQCKGV